MIDEKEITLADKIDELKKKFKEYKKDGMTFNEVLKFILDLIKDIIYLAQESFMQGDNETKKNWVVDNIKALWRNFNIDIPWFPDNIFLAYILPSLIDWLIQSCFKKDPIYISLTDNKEKFVEHYPESNISNIA